MIYFVYFLWLVLGYIIGFAVCEIKNGHDDNY